MKRKMIRKKDEIKKVLKDYLDWECNTYYVMDRVWYPTSTELCELIYFFKQNIKGVDEQVVDTLYDIVLDFRNKN